MACGVHTMKYFKYSIIALALVLLPQVSFGAVSFTDQSAIPPTDYPGTTVIGYNVIATGADIGRSFYVGSKTSTDSVDVSDPSFCHVLPSTTTLFTDNILLPPAGYVDLYYYKFSSADCTGNTGAPTSFYSTTWTVPYPSLTPSDSAFLQSECTTGDNEVCVYSGTILFIFTLLFYFIVFCTVCVLVYNLGKRIMK